MSWLSRRDLDGWLPFFSPFDPKRTVHLLFSRVRWVCERCTSQFDKYEGGRNFYSFTFLSLLFFVFRRPLHLQLPSPSASFPCSPPLRFPSQKKAPGTRLGPHSPRGVFRGDHVENP